MPMSSSQDTSMFPAFDFNLSACEEQCWKDFGVRPRPKWITTEFGGHVRDQGHVPLSLKIRKFL